MKMMKYQMTKDRFDFRVALYINSIKLLKMNNSKPDTGILVIRNQIVSRFTVRRTTIKASPQLNGQSYLYPVMNQNLLVSLLKLVINRLHSYSKILYKFHGITFRDVR